MLTLMLSSILADSMTSEQRQKLARERREERARYIGRKPSVLLSSFDSAA